MLELFFDPQTYISLVTLTLLEIVLGIDNIVFISILVAKLPEERRQTARVTGLLLAVVGRLALLMGIVWLTKLTKPFLNLHWVQFSGKDLIMLLGGLFLIWKSAQEIYEKVEEHPHTLSPDAVKATFLNVITQIILIDMVFSLDSILTAIGLVQHIPIMVTAILVSVLLMIMASAAIGNFIEKHLSVKILALSFLLMIGTVLVSEAFHVHIPKGYIYFSLAFALLVEAINIKTKSRAQIQ